MTSIKQCKKNKIYYRGINDKGEKIIDCKIDKKNYRFIYKINIKQPKDFIKNNVKELKKNQDSLNKELNKNIKKLQNNFLNRLKENKQIKEYYNIINKLYLDDDSIINSLNHLKISEKYIKRQKYKKDESLLKVIKIKKL